MAGIDEIDKHYGNLYEEAVLFTPIGLEKNIFPEICEELTENDFTIQAHKILFSHIKKYTKLKLPTNDLTLIVTTLREDQKLSQVGGQDFIAQKAFDYFLTVGIPQHIETLKEYTAKRDFMKEISKAETETLLGGPVNEIISKYEKRLQKLKLNRPIKKSGVYKLSDVLKDVIKELEAGPTEKSRGIKSGFSDLDSMTGGFFPGELIIIAGRPGMGKSIFVNDIILNSKAKALYFSLEMDRGEIIKRMLSTKGRVSFSRIKKLDVADVFDSVIKGANEINDLEVYIFEGKEFDVNEIRAIAKGERKTQEIELIVIDYLQLLKTKEKIEHREREVSEISRQLKMLAMTLKVPIVCVAQLNRQCENRGANKRPILSDLRESGAIEQDADIVAFLYRDFIYSKKEELRNKAELLIEKGRNCPTGRVNLYFDGDHQSFGNWQESQQDWWVKP